MRFAADLHVHSRHAGGVSPRMELPEMARWARRKGIDVLGTGDCLHPLWFARLEEELEPAEPGLYLRKGATEEGEPRFLLSTEVCCAPPGIGEKRGLHHLIYFPDLASVRRFRTVAGDFGDLGDDGRPTLALDSARLAALVHAEIENGGLAPAHVLNPFYSSLGWRDGVTTLEEAFGSTGVGTLLAVEMGLPATAKMCRRLPCLDRHALFANSDAHSPWHIGREYTLFNAELSYPGILAALRHPERRQVAATIKLPAEGTRYYLNHCMKCEQSYGGMRCPSCGGPLAQGVRDRLGILAGRAPEEAGRLETADPPCRIRLPLPELIGRECGRSPRSKTVAGIYERLLQTFGDERTILGQAEGDAIAHASTPGLARSILGQRREAPSGQTPDIPVRSAVPAQQLDFGLV